MNTYTQNTGCKYSIATEYFLAKALQTVLMHSRPIMRKKNTSVGEIFSLS